MTRYRRVETGTFTDDRFRELTSPPPGGQWLWLNLLCGKRTTIFPGLVVATEAVLASDLGWPIHAVDEGDPSMPPPDDDPEDPPRSLRGAWRQLWVREMALADWIAGVVILPKALLDRRGAPRESARPISPNHVRGWLKSWSDVPECPLSAWYLAECVRLMYALDREGAARGGKANPYETAFETAFAAPIARAKEAYPNAFETRTPSRLERVAQALPNAFETRSRRVDHERSATVNAFETRPLTRSRPARDPDPVSLPDNTPDFSGSRPELEIGSESGSPALSAPDQRPTERSSAAPEQAPKRKGYPKAQVGATGGPAETPEGLLVRAVEPPIVNGVPAAGSALPLGTAVGTGAPDRAARIKITNAVWAKLNAIRAQMALEFDLRDVRGLHPMDPGVAELNARLSESGASGEESAFHVLRVAEAEARAESPPSVRWLTGSLFGPQQWRRLLGSTVADAVRGRGAKRGAPAAEYAGAAAALARERAAASARARIVATEEPPFVPDEISDDDRAELEALAAKLGAPRIPLDARISDEESADE